MLSTKIILVALAFCLSASALSRNFELSNQQLENLKNFAKDTDFVKKEDFKQLLIGNII